MVTRKKHRLPLFIYAAAATTLNAWSGTSPPTPPLSQQQSQRNGHLFCPTSSYPVVAACNVRSSVRSNTFHVAMTEQQAFTKMWPMSIMVTLAVLALCVKNISCDYENTWNFYNEQPCCGGSDNANYATKLRRGNYLNLE